MLSFAGVAALVRLGSGGDGGATLLGNLLVLARGAGGRRLPDHGARAARRAARTLRDDLPEPLRGAVHGAARGGRGGGGRREDADRRRLERRALPHVACSVSAYLLLNFGLSHVPANKASVFANLVPVVAVTAAFVVLGERLTAAQLAAGVVVIAGVWLANRRPRTPADDRRRRLTHGVRRRWMAGAVRRGRRPSPTGAATRSRSAG